MGTVIDRLDVTRGGWRTRHSALHLAVSAAQTCSNGPAGNADDLDLLVNVGLYRNQNIGGSRPRGAHPGRCLGPPGGPPRRHTRDLFLRCREQMLDVGALNGLQIVDGFLRSHPIDWALVVASDADPGRGMSEHFPFAPTGGAILCRWTDDEFGLGPVHWVNCSDAGESFCATVGLEDSRNVLRVRESDSMDERFATAGAQAARESWRHPPSTSPMSI